ncbi:uncharacterized protein ACNS7B_001065 isoform 2-T2 [Menidia menidia]
MQRPRFFTPEEVAAHNTAADCWVSFLGKVCDLSPLMARHEGPAVRGPPDGLCAVLHPPGALRARAPPRGALRLGGGRRRPLVEGPPPAGGPAVRQDPLGPDPQHADGPADAAAGVLGGDPGGDPGPLPALQRPRPQLHQEARRCAAKHGRHAQPEQRPGPGRRAGPAPAGPGPGGPRHPAALQ